MPTVDPLEWARHPKSDATLQHLRRHMKRDLRLAAIYAELVEINVCTAEGKLLCRWDGHKWVPN